MTALTAPRPVQSLETGFNPWRTFKVKGDVRIYPGAIVAIDAAGYLVPATAITTLRIVGIAVPKRQQMKQLTGYVDTAGLADGVVECEVQTCIANLANSSAGEALTMADVANDCYVADDQTVSKTDGGVAQVTEATVVYSNGDATGFTITGVVPVITVNGVTNAATTAIALANAANARADFSALYIATTNAAKVIVTKKTAGTFTLTKQVAGGADLNPITNTTAGVAASRSKAGKVWLVDSSGVWVALGFNLT